MLLVVLTWMWRYPKGASRSLASTFHTTPTEISRILHAVVPILYKNLAHLREWPQNFKSRIDSGKFKDSVGCVDSFPIFIPRPTSDSLRRKFFYYKTREWAWKVQVFVGLEGKILDISKAYPYGENSEQKVYKESYVYQRIDEKNQAIVVREDDEEEDVPHRKTKSRQGKALADKGYAGLPFLYRPHRKFKGKDFTKEQKQWNKALSHIRSLVENTHKRLKDFGVLKFYLGQKDEKGAEFLSQVVGVAASLVNMHMINNPIRRSVRRVKRSD